MLGVLHLQSHPREWRVFFISSVSHPVCVSGSSLLLPMVFPEGTLVVPALDLLGAVPTCSALHPLLLSPDVSHFTVGTEDESQGSTARTPVPSVSY